MIEINFPKTFTGELMKLIPDQREYITRMMKQAIIVNYSLSIDWQKLWVIVNAEDRFDAISIIEAFPMYEYMNYKIHNLLFHESSSLSSPQLWLN